MRGPHCSRQPDRSTMSYGWDLFDALPTRRLHLDSSRSMGFRTQSWSRGTASSLKHSPLSVNRGFSSLVHRPSDSMQLYQSGAFSEDHIAVSLNEKLLMQGLNDRFAGFIDKVRQLEQQNQGLEAEIAALRERQSSQSGLAGIYEPEMSELRNLILETENQKTQVLLDRDHLKENLQRLKEKYEAEAQVRLDTEASVQACKKDQENSNLVRLELERKAQSLMDEIIFLKNNHEEEVSDLFSQIQASQVSVEMKDFTKPDLAGALRAIRAQMEGCASINMQQAEEWFTSRVAKLNDAAAINKEALQSTRQEISEYSRQLQSKNIELETLRGRKESLEKQLNDAEARHDGELIQYQDTIQQLENELKNTKQEMTLHLREYQDLLNVKMALDVEIASYRKLLEGEETRFGDFTPSMYTYKPQPLVHTTKTKATPTKVMPQYRFVEEIISATTKEINLAELEAVGYKAVVDQEGKTAEDEAAEKEEEGVEKEAGEPKEAAEEEEEEKKTEEVEDKGEVQEEEAKEAEEEKEEEEKGEEEKAEVKEEKAEEKVEEAEEKVEAEEVGAKDEEKVEEAEEKVETKVKEKDEEAKAERKEEKVEEAVEKVEAKDEEKVEEAEEKVEGKDEEKVEEKAVEEKAEIKDGEVAEKTEEKVEEKKAAEEVKAEEKTEEKAEEKTEEKAEEKTEEEAEEKTEKAEEKVKVKDGEVEEKEAGKKAEKKEEKAEEVKDEEKISEEKSEEKEVSKTKEAEVVSADSGKGDEQVAAKPKETVETKTATEQGASETTVEGEETQATTVTVTGPMKDKETESKAKDEAASTEKDQ